MVRHCVTFRFAPDTAPEAIEAFAAGLSALPAAIPEIQGYWFGPDRGLRDTNADFAVVADFADEDGFRTYASHPAHVTVIEELASPIVVERSAVQFSC